MRPVRLQGDLHIFVAQACISSQLLSHLGYLSPNLLLARILNMRDNDAR